MNRLTFNCWARKPQISLTKYQPSSLTKSQPPSKRLSEPQSSCSRLQVHIRVVESSPLASQCHVVATLQKGGVSLTKPGLGTRLVGNETGYTMASPNFARELECGGNVLQIKQLYIGDVGCVVWDAAIVLCKFLENGEFFPPGYWNGKRVVDIGSGTGVAGLAAAVMGSVTIGWI